MDWIFTFACAAYNLVRNAQPGDQSSGGVSRCRGASGGALNQAERPGKLEINSPEHHRDEEQRAKRDIRQFLRSR